MRFFAGKQCYKCSPYSAFKADVEAPTYYVIIKTFCTVVLANLFFYKMFNMFIVGIPKHIVKSMVTGNVPHTIKLA